MIRFRELDPRFSQGEFPGFPGIVWVFRDFQRLSGVVTMDDKLSH